MKSRRSVIHARSSAIAATVAAAWAVAILVVWARNLAVYPDLTIEMPLMVPNTALGLFLGAIAVLLALKYPIGIYRQGTITVIAVILLTIATASLVEFWTGEHVAANHVLLDWFVPEGVTLAGDIRQIPAANSGIAFFLLGISLLFLSTKIAVAQIVAIFSFSVAAMAITAQAYRVAPFYRPFDSAPMSGMALSSAICFLLLAFGVFALRPGQGVLKFINSASPAGELFRRFTVAMIFVPLLFGVAALIGAGESTKDLQLILTSVSVLLLTGFTAVVWTSMRALARLEQDRMEFEQRLQDKEHALAEAQRVAELGSWDWLIHENRITWSEEVYRLFGLPVADLSLTYEGFLMMVHPEDRQRIHEAVHASLATKEPYSIDHRLVQPGGNTLWVHEQGIIYYDKKNNPIRMVGTVHNITDRMLAEQSLRKKEQLLAQVIDILPVGLWLMDRDGKIYRGNDAGKRIWGGAQYVGPENFAVYRGWWEHTGKEIAPEEWAAYRAIKFGQTSLRELVRIQCFDGTTKVILNSAIPLRADDGSLQGAIIVNEDITERRNAELAAAETAHRFRAFLENANDSVVTVDGEGKIRFANKQVETWFGYTKQELIGQPVELLIPDRFQANHLDQRTKYTLSPRARPMGLGLEVFARRKDGSEFPVDISLSPVHSKDGYLITAIIRDVTERKRLYDQQRFLSAVSQEISESIDFETTVRRAADLAVPELADWCIIQVLDENRKPQVRAVRHARPDQQEILQRTLRAHTPAESSTLGVLRVLRTGSSVIIPSVSRATLDEATKDETLKKALHSLQLRSYIIVPLKAHGEVYGTLTLAQGYSGRNFSYNDRPLAEDLAQRVAFALDNSKLYSEAVRAIRDREDVLSVVSHDLKNPLSAIRLATQLLEKRVEKLQESEAEKFKKFVRNISISANTMHDLIRNILDVGKIQAGGFKIETKVCELAQILRAVKEMFTPLAKEKNLSLGFEPEEVDISLRCDPDRLLQIFSNLIGNAIKFTQRGGHIAVLTENLGHELRVCVKDDGPGIPADLLARLFERHWQAEETAAKGSGLGLFISKNIVAAHGGRIWAESELGKGSCFYFQLPGVLSAGQKIAG